MVFSVDNETKKIVATVQNGISTEYYECSLLSCDNPVCSCGTVYVNFSPLQHEDKNSPISSCQVDIDVIQRKLGYKDEDKVSKDNLKFANLLLSKLDDTDFQFLWEGYFAYKNKKTEEATIDSIEADFDYQEVEKNGLMSAYNDILPYGDQMLVTINDINCIIFDQYCLLPGCPCTDTTLTIFLVGEFKKPGKELCSVALNYKRKHWGALEDGSFSVPIKTVKAAIEEQIPDFYKRLLKRHIKLKGIYAHCKKKHYLTELPLQVPKVGRNAPCPCGSGKKYKKCCLRKSN